MKKEESASEQLNYKLKLAQSEASEANFIAKQLEEQLKDES